MQCLRTPPLVTRLRGRGIGTPSPIRLGTGFTGLESWYSDAMPRRDRVRTGGFLGITAGGVVRPGSDHHVQRVRAGDF